MCQAPIWNTSLLYGPASEVHRSLLSLNRCDLSLAEMLDVLTGTMEEVCHSEKCGKPLLEHVTSFIHDSHKVSLTIKKSITPSARANEVAAFYRCQICSKRSELLALSEATLLCSFS
jgi:hypothetical protein